MVGVSMKKFAGSVPTTGDRALPEGFGVESVNTWFYQQELRGIRPPATLLEINPGIDKVFRIPQQDPPSQLPNSEWKFFSHPDTDVVKGVLINDQYDRFYFCSPDTGLMINTQDRLEAATPDYICGVEIPPTGPGVAVAGGSGNSVTRAYVYTYQTIFGEESGPSPATVVSGFINGTWNISLPSNPASQTGWVPLKYLILYRTITASSGLATYFQVNKFDLTAGNIPDPWPDTIADADLANALQLQTIGWLPPPRFKAGDPAAVPPTKDQQPLQGIIAMPNGFLVGWSGNDIYMSVPYQPHAWPAEYIVSTEFPIVGLGVIGNSCVVCTESYPSILTGVEPASTSFTKITTIEPCLSRGSIVSTLNGVYYASQNGLIGVTPGGMKTITDALITREQWITKFAPDYLRAVRYQNGYLALRCVPDPTQRTAFYLDPSQVEVALTELTDFDNVVNVIGDVWSGEVFVLKEFPAESLARILRWDAPSSGLVPLRWKSKEYQLPYEVNIGAYAVYWDEARFSDLPLEPGIIDVGERVRIKAWCNRRLVYDQNVPTAKNGKTMRMPSGFVGDIWQFEIAARAPVYSFIAAQTPRELRGD